jgi:hypothetical protein
MATHQYIYWRPDLKKGFSGEEIPDSHVFAHIHYLVGFNRGTITAFQEMAAELRKTFPQASDDEIVCGTVHKSSYCNRFSIIIWSGVIERKEYPDWFTTEKPAKYRW